MIFVMMNDKGSVGKTIWSELIYLTARTILDDLALAEVEQEERLGKKFQVYNELFDDNVKVQSCITASLTHAELYENPDKAFQHLDELEDTIEHKDCVIDLGAGMGDAFLKWIDSSIGRAVIGDKPLSVFVVCTTDHQALAPAFKTLMSIGVKTPNARRVFVRNHLIEPWLEKDEYLEDALNHARGPSHAIEIMDLRASCRRMTRMKAVTTRRTAGTRSGTSGARSGRTRRTPPPPTRTRGCTGKERARPPGYAISARP